MRASDGDKLPKNEGFAITPHRPQEAPSRGTHGRGCGLTASRLVLFGASVRAAAESAVRGGFCVHAADHFGDRDLLELSAAREVAICRTPQDFEAASRQFPQAPWFYTGAWENRPNVVQAISQTRPLWGCPPEVLRQVRDPFLLRETLQKAGIATADVLPGFDSPPRGTWLLKRYASCGGQQIARWHLSEPRVEHSIPDALADRTYWQAEVRGRSYAAAFLATPTSLHFLGCSRQWIQKEIPDRALQPHPYQYVGSVIGPKLSGLPQQECESTCLRMGESLRTRFGLVGLFGIDFIAPRRGRSGTLEASPLVPIEVNPRMTASMELFELASDLSLVRQHATACLGGACDINMTVALSCWYGKAIVYADRDFIVDDAFGARLDGARDPSRGVWIKDRPRLGTVIRRGGPICTVMVRGDSEDEVSRSLGFRGRGGWPRRILA